MRGTLLKIDVTSILNEPGASLPFDLSAEVRSPDEDLTLVGPVIARGVATSLGKEVYVQGRSEEHLFSLPKDLHEAL